MSRLLVGRNERSLQVYVKNSLIFIQFSFVHLFNNGLTALCCALVSYSVSYFFYTDGRTPLMSDQPVAKPSILLNGI
jgi:hypothetical protein